MKSHRITWVSLLMLLSTTCFGQLQPPLTDAELSATGPAKLLFAAMVAGCGVADSLAKADIARQQPFLLLAGGIALVTYTTDAAAEQQYWFRYYEYGCSSPDEACLLAYYLTATHGKRWLKAVRPDVMGLRAWRRSHR